MFFENLKFNCTNESKVLPKVLFEKKFGGGEQNIYVCKLLKSAENYQTLGRHQT